MGWFTRKGGRDSAQAPAGRDGGASAASTLGTLAGGEAEEDIPLRPVLEPLGETERERISTALEELAGAGVDVDDLSSLGAGLDAAFTAWEAAPQGAGEPHDRIVNRYAMGIGEHLNRHTDLRWQLVTDAFGTDLGVAGGMRGDFVVVPTNLVAVRWLRRERGWVPGVVGHLVRRRSER